MRIVYIDILILVNFIINLMIIRCASFLTSENVTLLKAGVSAFLGSLCALTIFLPAFSFATVLSYKIIFASVMVFTAFKYQSMTKFLKDLFCLLVCSFIFSGFISFIYISFKPSKMIISNGSVYFDITAGFLIFVSFISYLMVSLLDFILKRKNPKTDLCRIEIINGKRKISMTGLLDTGSSLYEPFSHLPVIVCEKKTFEGEIKEEKALKNSLRLVPVNSLGGTGLLTAFLADKVVIFKNGGDRVVINKGCYIALTDKKISSDRFRAIINPVLLEEK